MEERINKKNKTKKKQKSRRESPPPRGRSPPPSLRPYTIPKTGSKELFASILLESREGKEIIKNINNTLWDANSVTLDILKLELVQNTALQTEYSTKRKEMRDQNHSTAETADSYGFLFFRNIAECKKACSTGIERKSQYLPSGASCCIGDRKYGVYLCRCADVLKRTPLWNSNLDNIMLICKFMKGRLKSVQEQPSHGATSLEPTPDFDGHTSKNFQRGKKGAHDRIYNSSQIYLYEIDLDNFSEDDDSAIFAKRPRQCLPYAIATFRAKQKTQQQVISKPPAPSHNKSQVPPSLSSPNTVMTERVADNVNIPEVDYEALSQQRIKFLWSGFYYNNETQLAQIQIGAYIPHNIKLPIEGPHLCITQKISIEKLSKIFPHKIFRKPPVCTGGSLVSVENIKFLHAEIHPVTVTSAKIDKLHSHWLKTKMAGVCTLGSGLKLFIVPTGPFTDRIGISCPGYPQVLHCIFMRQFLDSACVFDKDNEEYSDFKKTVNNHLRDRLGHNEELKNQNSNVMISAKLYGYSGPERLKVLSAFGNIRRIFDGTRNRRNDHNIVTQNTPPTPTPVATTTTTAVNASLDPRLLSNKAKEKNQPEVVAVNTFLHPRLSLDKSKEKNSNEPEVVAVSATQDTRLSTSNAKESNQTGVGIVDRLGSMLHVYVPTTTANENDSILTQDSSEVSKPSDILSTVSNTLSSNISTQSTATDVDEPTIPFSVQATAHNIVQPTTISIAQPSSTNIIQTTTFNITPATTADNNVPSMFEKLISSPCVKLLKQTNPEMFEQITGQKATETTIPVDTPAANVNDPEPLSPLDNSANSTCLLSEDMELESTPEKISSEQTIVSSASYSGTSETDTTNVSTDHLSVRTVQHNVYRRSVASSLLSMLYLSDETCEQEKEMQSKEDHWRGQAREREESRERYRSSRDRERSRGGRKKDRSKEQDMSRGRKRDRSHDRDKTRKDTDRTDRASSGRRDSPPRYRSRSRDKSASYEKYTSDGKRLDKQNKHDPRAAKHEKSVDKNQVAEKLQEKFMQLEKVYEGLYNLDGSSVDNTKKNNEPVPMATESACVYTETNDQPPDRQPNRPSDRQSRQGTTVECDIPFLESQDETDDNWIIDTDTQPSSSQVVSDDAVQNDLVITRIRKDIDEAKAGTTLQAISDAFYDDSSIEKITSPTSNSSILSPTSALDALKGEMRKKASEVLTKRHLEKQSLYQDISSESDLGNIETTIINQRIRRKTSTEQRKLDHASLETSHVDRESVAVANDDQAEASNRSVETNVEVVERLREAGNKDLLLNETRSPFSSVSSSPAKTIHEDNNDRKSQSHSRGSRKHRSRSRGRRSRSRDRYRSGSKKKRHRSRSWERSKDRYTGKRRHSPSRHSKRDSPHNNNKSGYGGRSNSPLFTPSTSGTPVSLEGSLRNEEGDTKKPAESVDNLGQGLHNRPLAELKKSQSGSKSTGYDDIKAPRDIPRATTWKLAMQRTEERRGKYSSSSEEDKEIDQNKTNPKKRSSATNKTFEKLSKKQASDVKKVTSGKAAEVKPRLSDVVLSDDEEKETKQIDHVKQSIVRLIVEETSVEPVADFRLSRQSTKHEPPEPLLPKQKKSKLSTSSNNSKSSKERSTPSHNSKPPKINDHAAANPLVIDRSQTPPLEVLMFQEVQAIPSPGIQSSMLNMQSPTVMENPTMNSPQQILPVLSYQGLFPQVFTPSGFNSYAGMTATTAVFPSRETGSFCSRGLTSSFISPTVVSEPTDSIGKVDSPITTTTTSIDRGITTALSSISSGTESCGVLTKKARSLKEWNAQLPRSELDDFCADLIKNVTKELE